MAMSLALSVLMGSAACGSKTESGQGPAVSSTGETTEAAAPAEDSGGSTETAAPAEGSNESTATSSTEAPADETDYSNVDILPMFSYNQVLADSGFKPLEAAAYDHLAFDQIKEYDFSHVLIPYVRIVDVDESDPEDVLLYGDYWLWEFERQGDTLVAVSGGHCPGIIHLERFGEGEGAAYSPKGTMDEALTDADTKSLFGEYYEHYVTISSDDQTRNAEVAQIISDYVAVNGLDITKYQIGGEEPSSLPAPRVNG